MAYTTVIYKVLLSSPNDVEEERKAFPEVITEWNYFNSARLGAVLLPVLWEHHSVPQMGNRAQAIVDEQFADCDLLIGVFWSKLGTPTGKHESGTAEEIDEFMRTKGGENVMIYFSNAPIPRNLLDTKQLERLEKKKEEYKKNGLIWEFDTTDEFRKHLYNHLTSKIEKIHQSQGRFIEESKIGAVKWTELTKDEQTYYFEQFMQLQPQLNKPESPVVNIEIQENLQKINLIKIEALEDLLNIFDITLPDNVKIPLTQEEYTSIHNIDLDLAEKLYEKTKHGVSDKQQRDSIDNFFDYLGAEEWEADKTFIRECDVVIVPGCRVQGIRHRIEKVDEIWRKNEPHIILTGNHPYYDREQTLPIGEAEAMLYSLQHEKDVDLNKMNYTVENRARNTQENVIHCLPTLSELWIEKNKEPLNIILITAPYHMRRFYFSFNRWLSSEINIACKIRCVLSASSFDRGNWYLEPRRSTPRKGSFGVGLFIREFFKLIGGRATGEF